MNYSMIVLKKEGTQLSRDVIYLATADEEVNDEGSLWMIANKADLFKNAEFLLTEYPGAITQGDTLDELAKNMEEAISVVKGEA